MNGESLRYSDRVRELFRSLPGAGGLAAGPGAVVQGEAAALERGAWVRFEARVDGGRIADCAFRAWGCPHTLAAAAWLVQTMRGCRVAEAAPGEPRELAHEIGAPPQKLGRLFVVIDAQAALLAAARALQ
jgi:NifU-like protein involved in Fe-S cluster formation